MERSNWSSRSTFILATVGAAVGLGNAWRFPGLVAKHGGGAFLFVYILAMFVLGVPLLMMEISIGRKMRSGAPNALGGLNKKFEWVGWAAAGNAFVVTCYYAVVFAWVILMLILSYRFAGITAIPDSAEKLQQARILWQTVTKSTGTTKGLLEVSIPVVLCLFLAWGMIYYCIRGGTKTVGKVVKYTVLLPIVILLIMAAKGLTMDGAGEGMRRLFIPDFSALTSPTLWLDAFGQVFYSMSVMMAVMFAYGSYLSEEANIASDGIIIALADVFISVLAGVVMFSTMGGTGMLDNISDSGVATAFMIYPQAIVSLTNIGWVNAAFGALFYLCLITLAIDSAFAMVEGVSVAISDKFGTHPKKTTVAVCLVAGVISLVFTTGAGAAYLDIVDTWTNQYNMVIVGVLECVLVGYFFSIDKVRLEINRNANGFKMPSVWFHGAIREIAPIFLTVLIVWNLWVLFRNGGIYGAERGYTLISNIIAGWLVSVLVFSCGAVVKKILKRSAKFREREKNTPLWK